ncbi:MAG: hypothetical protein KKE64_00990, partial [Candidatus Omnitrophica bacterium]|nr:hypothetical protein [Candidatus Omnitrophota bacterium]
MSIARSEIKGIFFYRKAKLENERLIRQISLFNQKLNRANEAFLENRRLNALLSLKENSNFKCIASRVIGRDPDNWSSIVIIDKGTSSGIRNSYSCVNFLGLV